jgi:membrane protease YdiL (CAAX protease family)
MLFPSPSTPLLWHILAFLLIVVGPLLSYFYERPLLRAISSSRQKIGFYGYVLAVEWSVAALAAGIAGPASLFFPPLPHGQGLPAWSRILIGVLLAAFFLLALMPFLQSLRGEKYRAAYARAYQRSLDEVSRVLPATHQERLWFAAVSLTAGVCEELLCRGFLFRYLDGIALHLPLPATLSVAAAIFGLNHIYQGKIAILKTGVAGLAFGALFLVTGNLLIPMLLHAAIDLQMVFVLRPAKPQLDQPIPTPSS